MVPRVLLSAAFCLVLTACAPFAPTPRDVAPVGLPSTFSTPVPADGATPAQSAPPSGIVHRSDRWWLELASPELDRLMETALSDSFDVGVAFARLAQSEAAARQAGAALFPALDLDGGAAHKRQSTRPDSSTRRIENAGEPLSLGLAAGYELDLWGRVRSTDEAARLSARASADEARSALMTVAASVADTWAALLGVRAEQAVLERQIRTNRDLVDIQLTRYANAQNAGLDVLQQEEVYLASLAEQPPLIMQARTLRAQLTVLLGLYDESALHLAPETALPLLPPPPAVGLPADLLTNRPDVRAAWHTLAAGEWDVSAAQAARLPALRLTGNAAYNTPDASVFFSNWLLSLAANLTGPLFDAGKSAAAVDRARAVVEERVNAYGRAVSTAVQEVDNALTDERQQRALIERLNQQLEVARIAQREAGTSYLGGRDSFLRYITQLQNVQKLERRVVREEASLVRYRVALHRALGGGWMNAHLAPSPATHE